MAPIPFNEHMGGRLSTFVIFTMIAVVWVSLLAWAFVEYPSIMERFHSVPGSKPLFDSFKVGSSETQVLTVLQSQGYKANNEERHLPTKYYKSSLVLEIANYHSLGCTGTLLLQFYDGSLYQTRYYPDDLPAYLNRLEQKQGFKLSFSDKVYDKGVEIWTFREGDGKQYVGFEDIAQKMELDKLQN